ncbi:MAG: hypothetical protein GF313_04780 [Caldithrix sp.]|nr:hypothetical protein [Caldithrix sp.]
MLRQLNVYTTLILGILLLQNAFTQENFEEWKKKDRQKFQNYLDEQDKAFLKFLEQDWKAFQTDQGVEADPKPKPVEMPVAPKPQKPPERKIPKPEIKESSKKIKVPKPKPKPITEPEIQKPVSEPDKPQTTFDFFDKPLTVNYESPAPLFNRFSGNKKDIAAAWTKMAKSDYNETVQQLQTLKNTMRLNDWGYVLLIHAFSQKTAGANINQQLLLDWFFLNKSGLQAKVAYQGKHILLMIPTRQMMYETPFTVIDGKRFYFAPFGHALNKGQPVYTYRGSHQAAEQDVGLDIVMMPVISRKNATKKLTFTYEDNHYALRVKYNADAIKFFNDYPQTELSLFFTATPSEAFQFSLLDALRPHVDGMTELQAVNFLLRFAQTAFGYKTDDIQFGREKYLLPEETIHYPDSDCEDRSILFAFLVEQLLGKKILILDYPGHISTAVNLGTTVSGDHVNYKGKQYTVCDPTYVNARAGMAMPEYRDVTPKILGYK